MCLWNNQPGVPSDTMACTESVDHICPVSFNKTSLNFEICYNIVYGLPHNLLKTKIFLQQYTYCTDKVRTRTPLCVHKLTQQCLRSKVVSFKTIRLSMELLPNILQNDKEIKILYLVRDPRGIVSSRQRTQLLSKSSLGTLSNEGKLLCERMRNDLRLFDKLQQRYHDQMLLVRYEDLARKPLQLADIISRFSRGTPLSDSVFSFLRDQTQGKADGSPFGTKRANSSQQIEAWRERMPTKISKELTDMCRDILHRLYLHNL